MGCLKNPLIQKVCELYEKISSLESLKPCKDVNMLFTELVLTCMPPNPNIEVTKLCQNVQDIRSKLISLCGEAEGLLESHHSTILGSFDDPLNHLDLFPYYDNYLKLSLLEFNILSQFCTHVPSKVAFVGSGPLPLTSIVLATKYLTKTVFHNYDIDESANSKAVRMVSSDPDLSKRMFFHTMNIMDVTNELGDYQVVFLAALVGMDKETKIQVIEHLAKYMAPEAILMLRSAHGARGFLYPIVDSCDLKGFEVLSVYHPTNEVINSVVITRKLANSMHHALDLQEELHIGSTIMIPNKCCSTSDAFKCIHHGKLIEGLAMED